MGEKLECWSPERRSVPAKDKSNGTEDDAEENGELVGGEESGEHGKERK